jgi:hypothetical protein
VSGSYQKAAEVAYCEVWLHKNVAKVLRHAPAKDRARVGAILGRLAENGPDDLHEEQFKFEERFKVGHERVPVYAVKSYQLRVLGGWNDGPPRKFVCPEAAIKQRDEADRDQLERVARKVGEYDGD